MLNPCLEVDQYPLPKPEERFATISGGERFMKLDLSQAFQQMVLGDDSQDLVTINTHRGVYRYTPFAVWDIISPSLVSTNNGHYITSHFPHYMLY